MHGLIETYQARSRKWRWRFSERNHEADKWDIVAVGTGEYKSQEAAELHARCIIVNSWGVEVGLVVEARQVKTHINLKQWFNRLLASILGIFGK
jgi:hypothetical protein